jgi:FHA domain/zinc-ribbon domain
MPVLQCARCGRSNAEGSRFCSNCGNPLTAAAAQEAQQQAQPGYPPQHPPQGGPPAGRPPGPGSPPRPGETTLTVSYRGEEPDYGENLYPDSASVGALPVGDALLIVLRGPNAGSTFRLDNVLTTAGRHPDSDIFLDDVTVSRRHAEFYRDGDRITVRDVGSLNGTYVNRERIEEAELFSGDDVQIGKFRLQFLSGRDSRMNLGGGGQARGAQGYA